MYNTHVPKVQKTCALEKFSKGTSFNHQDGLSAGTTHKCRNIPVNNI